MASGDGPSGGKRGAPRVDASSLALVVLVLAVCQTTLVRAGKTLFSPCWFPSDRLKRLGRGWPACVKSVR